jgi:hypothetical protein
VAQNEELQLKTRRHLMRQWLGIESCAYVLLCLVLVTTAWTNHFVSTATVLVTWAIAGCALILAFRAIYRGRHQPSP